MMRLFIRYNQTGAIVSAMKVMTMPESMGHPYGELEEGETVLEIEPTVELEALDCSEICDRFVMDTSNNRLVPKEERREKSEPGAKRSGQRRRRK
jgi:hypothetical protein